MSFNSDDRRTRGSQKSDEAYNPTMSLRWRTRLMGALSHPAYRPTSVSNLVEQLAVPAPEVVKLREALTAMVADGLLTLDGRDIVRLPPIGREVIGRIRVNPRGFAFVIPPSKTADGDLFIPEGYTKNAVTGDLVRATVMQFESAERKTNKGVKSGKGGPTGRVLEIIERGQTTFAGTLQRQGHDWIVLPDGRLLSSAVLVRDPHAKNAKVGDKVIVDVTRFPTDTGFAEGVIVEVLGEAGRPDVETQAVIRSSGLREEFPPEALTQAVDAAQAFERDAVRATTEPIATVFPSRDDFTSNIVFTIDPPDARDFDDAIEVSFDESNKEWTLGVHIADVSHFVTTGSSLDIEAAARGNSVYLPRHVIPMLPESLSNGVCSLQEGVARRVLSVFVTFNEDGRPRSEYLRGGVIRSRKRFTYLEAQAIIDGDRNAARTHARSDTEVDDEVRDGLLRANRLAQALRARRLRDGLITLELPDSELVFDDEGRVKDVVPEDNAFTHTLIEMCMVEANDAVARIFAALEVPLLRRIHPEPSPGAMEELRVFARGAQVRIGDEPDRRDLQKLLDAVRGTDRVRAVHLAVLKSLSKATYSPALIGHFALASEHYAHFTSPIRRYPDLLVHRTVEAFLDFTKNGHRPPGGKRLREVREALENDSRVTDEEQLITIGRHCTDTEIGAEEAERDLRTFLVLQFLKEHFLGGTMRGVVTGLLGSGNGIAITLDKYLVDGLIRFRDVSGPRGNERWSLHPATGRVVNERTGLSVGLGDPVEVTISAIDLPTRELSLTIDRLGRPREDHVREAEPTRIARGNAKDAPESGSRWRRRERKETGRRGAFKQGRRGRKSR